MVTFGVHLKNLIELHFLWTNEETNCTIVAKKRKKKMMKFSEITDNVQFWVNILCIGLPS